MKLENYEVHLPNYSIGDRIYDKIGPVCESYGKKVLIIGGRRALNAAEDKIRAYVAKTNLEIIGTKLYGTDCTYATVEKLREMPEYEEADMVFGVGGGKALDTVKCLCITDDKPVFAFPTIASNCAACTSVSIMYNEDGTFLKPNFFVRPVMHSFIDTEIIASQYMWAGIGDTYAKYYEAAISSRDERLEHFTSLGVATSHMCRDPLLMYGVKALEDHKKGLCTYEVEQAVLAIVVTTGIASIFLTKDFTPDYNSGLAHAVFYALTSYPVIEEKHLHGACRTLKRAAEKHLCCPFCMIRCGRLTEPPIPTARRISPAKPPPPGSACRGRPGPIARRRQRRPTGPGCPAGG